MEFAAAWEIAAHGIFGRSLKESYWAASKYGVRFKSLLRPPNRAFGLYVAKNWLRYCIGVRPITGETERRARAAAAWLARAQDANSDGGVAQGYFPCEVENGWCDSYPETTGYIITTLLQYSARFGDTKVRQRAMQMALWEAQIQMPSGAVQGGRVCPPDKQTPCAFNTGMVLDGWCSAYQASGNRLFFSAGKRAADYLLGDLTADGYFRTNGQFVAASDIKTYNCLCAWPLYRFADISEESRYKEAALKLVEASLRQRQANGWFANNCLTRLEAPLLHTIAYTLQGILEVAILARRADYIQAVGNSTDAILCHLRPDGFLPGRFYSNWRPAVLSSCLTGSAQMAIVCYRLYEHTGLRQYWAAAESIVNYLKALQEMDSYDPAIIGALAGSFPILGEYMSMGYPNWATKYLLDSLILQDRLKEQ